MTPAPDWTRALAEFPVALRPILDGIRPAGGRLPADATRAALQAAGVSLEQLMVDLLPLAASYSVAPISRFHVGAIAAGPGPAPTLYFGANLEFAGAALGCSVHAEQAAINHAWLAGEPAVARLAVTDAPCGHCRQFLQELAGAPDLVLLLRGQGRRTLAELLPRAFGPDALGVGERLLQPQRMSLAMVHADDKPLISQAREAAERSHAPYSRCPAGCALEVEGARTQTGRTAESAAYNPTLTAFASAASALVLRDGPGALRRVTRAVLVEKPGAASQRTSAAGMAASAMPDATFDYFAAR
ncbi:MAG TPA: cytidine deaminase [Opitutaceae bacterium]|nr:cytidine deaminase [Opitutaceae bacterium]